MPCCCSEGVAKSAGQSIRRLSLTVTGPQTESEIFEQTLEFISKVPLFQLIPDSEYPALAKAFVLKEYKDGNAVITQGEMGDAFYVVRRGKAKVLIDGKQVSTLGTGDFFGEQALLHERPRNATIIANGKLNCSVISREDFNAQGLRKKLNFKKRKAIQMVDTATEPRKAVPAKTEAETAFIKEAFAKNKDLSHCHFNEQELQDISNEAFLQEVKAGTDVIVQGDTKADLFYILQAGTAEAIKDGVKVDSYTAKGSFGGLALLYQAPRAATVTVTSEAKLWCIPRSALRAVLQQEVKNKVAEFAKILDKVKMLEALSQEEKENIADALMETTYSKGDEVTKQGAESKAFFMLQEGELACFVNGKKTGTIKARKGYDFPFFGEDALMEDLPCSSTINVVSSKAKCLVLPKDVYHTVIDVASPSLSPRKRGFIQYDLNGLTSIGLLGCGGFGKVTLERYNPTGQYFAVKKLSKGFVLKMNQEKSIMNEKRILRMTQSPFLVRCAATFNTSQHLFFLLEPALGGELFTLYMVNQLHGKENLALFYSACVVMGFEHLHDRCIVYRDMKPENLLLDEKGYCKITDFGLAKFCVGKTFTTCGTPDYFAPELCKAIGHNTSLDWWTLGILIFEMMTGTTPFAAEHPQATIFKVMDGIESIRFPIDSRKSKWPSLTRELCKMDPSERLPVRPGGIKNLEDHEWYKSKKFNWTEFMARKMRAPYQPDVKEGDLSNFEVDGEEAPPEIRYSDPRNGWDAEFEDRWGPKVFRAPVPGGADDDEEDDEKRDCICM